jgi:ureidoglycolate amidohydrolase
VIGVAASADWLGDQIERLAGFNDAPELGGVTREVFTPTYGRAAEHVANLMEDVGLVTRVDAFGNLFGRWAVDGEEPVVLTGSHIDTTLNAGRFDGVVGVLGAIEAVRVLREEGLRPRLPIEVVAFAGEEPRFGTGCIGSRALVGELTRADLDDLRDRDGVTLAAAMAASGADPERLAEVVLPPGSVAAMVELHVEQGAVLERAGIPIGIVERIAAPHDLRVVIDGDARHSGSTPMALRRDALLGAAEAAIALESVALASPSPTVVATAGAITGEPGAINVIAGRATLLVDIRDTDRSARDAVTEAFLTELQQICARRNLTFSVETLAEDAPLVCAPAIVSALRDAARRQGTAALDMASGAYHDAMIIGRHFPAGMIFAPSVGGISHSPEEHTALSDLLPAVAVLAGALAELTR